MKRPSPLHIAVVVLSALFVPACGSPPEHCHGCLALLADGGVSATGGRGGGGGVPGDAGNASGGVIGGGGMDETGGATASGGMPGTGGVVGSSGGMIGGPATGGMVGTGGAATGGTGIGGGAATGGRVGTGGAPTGGTVGTGGTAMGGMVGTGGAAMGGAGMGGAAVGTGGAAIDPDLVLWYKFDESSGTTAGDSAMSGGTARNGTVYTAGGGTATFSTTHVQVGTRALSLGGSSSSVGGYVATPNVPALAPTAITIAVWVYLNANTTSQNWERVFDFGANTTSYMFLTARAGDSPYPVRFGITTTGNGANAEQRLSSSGVLSTGAWHHVVVVLSAGATYTGRLFIDSVQVATNTAMTLHPSDLGSTTGNYLGRSAYPADPYFNGYLDDFRVYKRALMPTEITTLYGLR